MISRRALLLAAVVAGFARPRPKPPKPVAAVYSNTYSHTY